MSELYISPLFPAEICLIINSKNPFIIVTFINTFCFFREVLISFFEWFGIFAMNYASSFLPAILQT